jgi:hypothetical protein
MVRICRWNVRNGHQQHMFHMPIPHLHWLAKNSKLAGHFDKRYDLGKPKKTWTLCSAVCWGHAAHTLGRGVSSPSPPFFTQGPRRAQCNQVDCSHPQLRTVGSHRRPPDDSAPKTCHIVNVAFLKCGSQFQSQNTTLTLTEICLDIRPWCLGSTLELTTPKNEPIVLCMHLPCMQLTKQDIHQPSGHNQTLKPIHDMGKAKDPKDPQILASQMWNIQCLGYPAPISVCFLTVFVANPSTPQLTSNWLINFPTRPRMRSTHKWLLNQSCRGYIPT